MKTCSSCKNKVPKELFHKHSKKTDGLQSICKKCKNTKEIFRKQIRNSNYLRLYGITLEKYDNLATSQNNCCAICGKAESNKKLAVDHCHKTGKVRKLLCSDCNVTLGKVKENINILESMIAYLKEHNNDNR